ncbi:hypothetical protein ACJJTC_005773 [Scirpophaga incertulas]
MTFSHASTAPAFGLVLCKYLRILGARQCPTRVFFLVKFVWLSVKMDAQSQRILSWLEETDEEKESDLEDLPRLTNLSQVLNGRPHHTELASDHNYQRIPRRDYLRSVAIELIKPQMRQRLMTKNLPRTIKEKIMMFLAIKESDLMPEDEVIPKKRTKTARCYDCGRAKDRSTRTFCQKCQKPVCNDHKYAVCLSCYNKYVTEPKE